MISLKDPILDRFLGQTIQLSVLLLEGEMRSATNGNEFWWGEVRDCHGRASICCWEHYRDIELHGAGTIIEAKFKVKNFNDKLQLVIKSKPSFKKLDEENTHLYIKPPEVTRTDWLLFFDAYIKEHITDPAVLILIEKILAGDKFWKAPAGKSMHGDHRGGLADHVFGMLNVAHAALKAELTWMKKLNKQIIFATIILHDLGKVWDYAEDSPGSFSYTRKGALVPHVVSSPLFVERFLIQIQDKAQINPEVKQHLIHALLSHHGRLDWGSPVEPSTPEAIFIHYIDLIEARVCKAAGAEDGEYVRMLHRKIYQFQTEE